MELYIQIQTITISFVYGMLISYVLKLHYKYFFESRLWYKILISLLFTFDNTILYFLILRLINNAVFHLYFILFLILGVVFGYNLIKKRKK